ncbi:hypothetical protein M0R04_04665 [Candidatus Dojkabacteria bacterium]|jgi:hypothetical protein|nr:hypothetical protein [Candidatus Dojkabacteria bacterium]
MKTWSYDPETNSFSESYDFKRGPRFHYTITTVVWELSKNNWVCADYSTLNDTMKNLRGYFETAQEIMDMEDDATEIILKFLKENP